MKEVQKPSVLQTYRFFNPEGSIKTDPSANKGSADYLKSKNRRSQTLVYTYNNGEK
jgi:hypothetical protein